MNYNVLFEKIRAKRALKGNWQTALVVVFFAGVLVTLQEVTQFSKFPSFSLYAYQASLQTKFDAVDQYLIALRALPVDTWVPVLTIAVLSLVFTPALMLGRNWYLINRIQGKELGVEALFSRLKYWFPAFRLTLIMSIRIFLYSLLFIVPGIIAAMWYSMAPYFMAQDPTLTAREAIRKSKKAMKNHKMHYVILLLSFIGWYVLSLVAQNLLLSFGTIVALVGVQFINLNISTYQNAALAAFFQTVSTENGKENVTNEMEDYMKSMGFTPPVSKKQEEPIILDEDPADREEKE